MARGARLQRILPRLNGPDLLAEVVPSGFHSDGVVNNPGRVRFDLAAEAEPMVAVILRKLHAEHR